MRTMHEEIRERLEKSQNMEQLKENYGWLAEEYHVLNAGTLLMEKEIAKRYGKNVLNEISKAVADILVARELKALGDDEATVSDLDVEEILRGFFDEEAEENG